jgi:recombination associated protein RdgC
VLPSISHARKFRFLDIVQDSFDAGDDDSQDAELDARFALMTREIQQLLDGMEHWFGLERPA